DASSFTAIGNRTARNSGNRELYSFEDPVFFRGIVYYRLRSVDNDGTFSYSKIIALSEKDIISSDFVVLNPVRYAITIFNKTTEQGVFGYRLINSGGQVILQGNVNFELNGNAVIQLPSQTASGTYVLELRNSNILFTRQVLVER
ncbi:MAG: T9SS type A sorting domain-containing protein, partial [Chitinophagaceae bacterium]|nr:T9SS type A sorting domain-containing protein [Chitinophagaceae bacterium]